jgi:NADH-quinone oxidoreductase subunit N
VLDAPASTGPIWLAVVMAVNVAIGLYYYLAWAAMLLGGPRTDAPPPSYRISVTDGLAIGATLGATGRALGAPWHRRRRAGRVRPARGITGARRQRLSGS